MHAAGAEHSRLLARRDAEIESVIAVEARLLAVREEQQRLTRTVLDLRARIERLRAEGAEESENARVGEAGGDASSYAAVLRDSCCYHSLGSRHTTRPAHAGVGGHHTTVSPHVLYCVPTNPGPRSFLAQPIVRLLKPYSNLGPPIFRPPKVHEPAPNISRSRISKTQRVHL